MSAGSVASRCSQPPRWPKVDGSSGSSRVRRLSSWAPATEQPRRWSRAKVERWAERLGWETWETRPWRKRPD
jgi:hypothetical protein